jgi:hypothetical protein
MGADDPLECTMSEGKCFNCGGEDFHFDRSLCPCEPGMGAMHDYCNECGIAQGCSLATLGDNRKWEDDE